MYFGDDNVVYGKRSVGVALGVWRAGDLRYLYNKGINSTEAGRHCIAGGLTDHLWAVHGGRDDAWS